MLEKDFNEIANMIEQRSYNAYRKVNEELIMLYLDIGKYVSEKLETAKWGSKTVEQLAYYLKEKYPKMKGFKSRRSIYLIKQFYDTYKDNEIVQPLVAQIGWTNNTIILSRTKTMEEKEFYIRLCIQNNYSKRELERQIKSGYYERYMLSNKNDNALIPLDNKLNPRILDTYIFDFLDLPDKYVEKDIRKGLVSNMKDFILEIGKDFTFIGEEYRLTLNGEEYYIDLLFYNRAYKQLVAFELKKGKFKPEYISKMNFYLSLLNEQVKKDDEVDSLGVILCSDKDEQVVKFTMGENNNTKVSNYSLSLIDKSILENKLKELNMLYDEKQLEEINKV